METTLNQTTTNTETDLIIPEVVDENEVQLVAFKKKAYIVPLQNIVHCIQFEAGQMNKHEAEAGYIKTRIGLALIAAKELVKPRTFGSWMEQNFAGKALGALWPNLYAHRQRIYKFRGRRAADAAACRGERQLVGCQR